VSITFLQPQNSIAARCHSCFSEVIFGVRCLRPCPFARETVPKLALSAKPNPARQYHLARRGTARSLQFAQPGKPAFSRSCFLPSGTFFADHIMPRGRGWTNREYAYLAQAFMGNIRESNPRHGPDKPGLCTETGIPASSSTFANACAIRGGVQVNLRAIFSSAICGAICSAFANVTNVELPTRYAPRGRNLRKYGAAVEMHKVFLDSPS
jgi:hypothetical protein